MRFFAILGYNGSMDILYGKPVAEGILAYLKDKISEKEKSSVPGLAVILVGEDRASRIYVDLKGKKAKEIGMDFSLFQFSADDQEEEIISKIKDLNEDGKVNGVIVQVPLPEKFDTQKIINAILPEKDVDGFHPESIEKFKKGEDVCWPVFPKAIVTLLESSKEDIVGKSAIVVVNSEKFGEVMKIALKKIKIIAEYIFADKLQDNIERVRGADVIVTAVGQSGIIKGDMIKQGAIIIDGGIAEKEGKVLGDVDFESVKNVAGYVSPVPGGVGPVTIACLLENTYLAYKNQTK